MNDYSEICTVLRGLLRETYELANEGKMIEALAQAKSLSLMASVLVEELENNQ